MENKMPSMPGMPSLNQVSALEEAEIVESSLSVGSPEHESSGESIEKSDESFHVDQKSDKIKADETISNKVFLPPAPKSGIEVVALRKGFYRNQRREEGSKFVIKSMDDLGDWMECIDPVLEKKHKEMIKEKKARK